MSRRECGPTSTIRRGVATLSALFFAHGRKGAMGVEHWKIRATFSGILNRRPGLPDCARDFLMGIKDTRATRGVR